MIKVRRMIRSRMENSKSKTAGKQVIYSERDLIIKTKLFGGRWNRREGVWECTYETVKISGNTDRMVENMVKRNYNNKV